MGGAAAPNEPVRLTPPASGEEASRASIQMVSVIIPHFNDLEGLRKCLGRLRTQTLDPSRYEIIVADNNSSCGIAAVEQACEGVARVVPAPIQGAAEARNAAVAVARGEVLAFTDQDCRPMPHWLERGVRALDAADVVGGRIVVFVDDPMRVTPAEAFELVFAFNNRRYVERKRFTVNANMFVWRDVFARVGFFRVGAPEDVDWGRRATALGFRLRYAADAVVEHPARREWPDLIRKWRLTTRNHYVLARERPFGKLRFFARSWLILISPVVHIPVVLFSGKIKTFDQRLKAISVLVRLRAWRFAECNRILLKSAIARDSE
jgi:glycosyltransferase involved in cell wall biosynthesis